LIRPNDDDTLRSDERFLDDIIKISPRRNALVPPDFQTLPLQNIHQALNARLVLRRMTDEDVTHARSDKWHKRPRRSKQVELRTRTRKTLNSPAFAPAI
jgi:hypothetical protein